jgi:hypothetical protein
MTTRTTTAKNAKPAKTAYVATETHKGYAERAGLNAKGAVSAKAECNEACKELHKVKAKVGDARVCPLAQAFLAKRFDGKKVAASTKSNALNAFRKAVEKGVEYNENAARTAKKGAKAGGGTAKKGAKAGGGTIMIAISSGAKAKDAADKLRAGFNKMKDSGDELAKLAAFLLDGLDAALDADEAE